MTVDWEQIEAHMEGKHYGLVLEILDEAFPDYGVSPRADYHRGICYIRLDRLMEALDPLEQVVIGDSPQPLVLQCRLMLALVYNQTGRYRLAEFELRTLVDQGQETPQVYAALGYALYCRNQKAESLEMYKKAHGLDARNANALNSLGFVMADLDENPQEALTLCRRALNLDPENPAYLDSAGWACYRLGRFDEAKAYLRQAMKISGGHPEIARHMRVLIDN